MAKRISTKNVGEIFELHFHGGMNQDRWDFYRLIKVEGKGDDARATFQDLEPNETFEWEAYRFNGHWAYGSSANRLSVSK